MTAQRTIDALIETYRTLNADLRGRDEATLSARSVVGASARDAVRSLRDNELQFAQALKEHVSGVPPTAAARNDGATLGTEAAGDTTAALIAQFGTARESTLALLRELSDESWSNDLQLQSRTAQLIESDHRHLQAIFGTLSVGSGQ